MTDANAKPISELLFRNERMEMIRSGARPVSAHMAVEQSFMLDNLSLSVASILETDKEANEMDLGHFPRATIGGLTIFESRKMPPDRIEFRNAEGDKVGEIINLATPTEFK